MSHRKLSRRSFLAAAASTAAVSIVPAHVLGGPRHVAPSEKLNIAGIGIGGMGGANLEAVAASENIVALCDVDHAYAERIFKKYPAARRYFDYREMLDKQKDIDAVIVATPDHTHAVISMAAIKAGKHVYCQKPLTHDIHEARTLAAAAKEAKVATQLGIQGHSQEGTRLICEWIWDGAIGEVREVDAWCALSYYPWGHAGWSSRFGAERPKETPAAPPTLNWDLFIGPAPMRPYHPAYHPAVWRCWWDFGSGMMGDRGAHTLDCIYWALKLGAPGSIEATTMGGNNETHPLSAIVTYKFPARGDLPPLKLTWYEGTRAPRPEELEPGRQMGDGEGGVIFRGTKGKIMCGTYGNSPRLIPETLMQAYPRPKKALPRIATSHEMNWVAACKGGEPASAHFEYAAPLTEICCLGNIARRVDGRIEWDAAGMKVTNLPEANKFVRKQYREGWSL